MSGSREEDVVIRYRISGWIPQEQFKKLLLFSDYLGREAGESKFIINLAKAEENNLSIDDIIEILESMKPRISDRVIEALKTSREKILVSSSRYRVIVELEGSKVVIKPLTYLGSRFEAIKSLVRYDPRRKIFYTEPGLMYKVIDKLRSEGVYVEDRTGIQKDLFLSEKIEFRGELRDYQKEALDSWLRNKGQGVIALPTGSGKTLIGIAAIVETQQRTLIVTYTKEQLYQWIEKLREFTTVPNYMVSSFYSEEKRISPITVTTYQTAYRHIDVLAFRYSLLIVDEVHHLPADKFKRIALGMYSPYRMGLSATVIREDGRHVELFPLMGGIVYHKSPQELAEKGYLATYSTFLVRVRLTREEKKKYEELRKMYKALAEGRTFEEILRDARRGERKAINALKVHSKLKKLVQNSLSKEKAVKEIVEKELARGSKILVFTQYVKQAEKLAKMLNAYLITGSVDDKTRKRILEEFKNMNRGVLVLTTVGDEGLDIPDANVGIIVAGTGSRRQFIQRLGRLLRPQKGKTARLYEVIVSGTQEEFQARKRKQISIDDFSNDEF